MLDAMSSVDIGVHSDVCDVSVHTSDDDSGGAVPATGVVSVGAEVSAAGVVSAARVVSVDVEVYACDVSMGVGASPVENSVDVADGTVDSVGDVAGASDGAASGVCVGVVSSGSVVGVASGAGVSVADADIASKTVLAPADDPTSLAFSGPGLGLALGLGPGAELPSVKAVESLAVSDIARVVIPTLGVDTSSASDVDNVGACEGSTGVEEGSRELSAESDGGVVVSGSWFVIDGGGVDDSGDGAVLVGPSLVWEMTRGTSRRPTPTSVILMNKTKCRQYTIL